MIQSKIKNHITSARPNSSVFLKNLEFYVEWEYFEQTYSSLR